MPPCKSKKFTITHIGVPRGYFKEKGGETQFIFSRFSNQVDDYDDFTNYDNLYSFLGSQDTFVFRCQKQLSDIESVTIKRIASFDVFQGWFLRWVCSNETHL